MELLRGGVITLDVSRAEVRDATGRLFTESEVEGLVEDALESLLRLEG